MCTIPQLKHCPRCQQVKPAGDFARNRNRRDGLQAHCRACVRERDHARYERAVGHAVEPHPPIKTERGRKTWLISLKVDKPCADCGRVFPHQVMQWDHRPGQEKRGDISAAHWQWTREEVIAEISKCDLVCANCHAIRTFQRGGWGAGWLRENPCTYAVAA